MTRSMVWAASWVCRRGVDEVTGLGSCQRDADGLEVAHLTDQDDVGVLAQYVLEGVLEGLGVLADLALVDQTHLVPVQELDRVLARHDVLFAVAVGKVEQRRKRRRLARTSRTGDEDEATRQVQRSWPPSWERRGLPAA